MTGDFLIVGCGRTAALAESVKFCGQFCKPKPPKIPSRNFLLTFLEWRSEDKALSWEWAEILRGLDNLQEVEAEFEGHRFVMRGHVIGNAMHAIRGVGAALPPTIREMN